MSKARTFRTPALVLKRRPFGEADRLVTLLTPQHGKIDAIAKGARKPLSKKTGHVELFTHTDVLIARGRELGILTQAEVVKPFVPIREDLTRGAYANYVAELLDRFTYDADFASPRLFTLLDASFERICHDDDPRRVVRYFELRLLDEVGFRPELQDCVVMQEAVQPQDQFFSYHDGGVVSIEGANHTAGLVPLPLNTLKLLRHMQRSPYQQVAELRISDTLHADAERIMLGYIRYTLENRLQSVDFIRRIRQFSV